MKTYQKRSNVVSRKTGQTASETSFGVLGSSEREEFLFIQPNDYWTIRYQGHLALLKSTRGLHYLVVLLRHPGREFHVSELLAHALGGLIPGAGVALPEGVNGEGVNGEGGNGEGGNGEGGNGGLFSGFPVLDAQAKAEYKRRINVLRHELEEAERFNDTQRGTEIQNELEAICDNLASAVGLGGRDRKISSDAERARCAVTKCIKKAIQKVGEAIPSLGYHFAASIKTGYFCSYNPHPDRRVAWTFHLSLISLTFCELSLPLC
jgi:non-specific serine/threonine protein kinase